MKRRNESDNESPSKKKKKYGELTSHAIKQYKLRCYQRAYFVSLTSAPNEFEGIERLRHERELRKSERANWQFSSIIHLDFTLTYMDKLPAAVGKCFNLQSLILEDACVPTFEDGDWQLTALTELNLSDNGEMTQLPAIIGNFFNLKELNLSLTKITEFEGDSDHWHLTSLTMLDLTDNEAMKQLPAAVGNCFNLQTLNLSGTKISTFESGNWQLTSLTNLDLACNDTMRQLPVAIGNCFNLNELDLSCTRITGFEDDSSDHWHLISLDCLDFSYNESINQLPLTIRYFSTLYSIWLQKCPNLTAPSHYEMYEFEGESIEDLPVGSVTFFPENTQLYLTMYSIIFQ